MPKNGQKPFSGDPGDPVPHGYTLACTLHYAAVMFSCRHMTAAAAVSTLMQFFRTFVHRTTKTFLYAFYGRNSKSEFPSYTTTLRFKLIVNVSVGQRAGLRPRIDMH